MRGRLIAGRLKGGRLFLEYQVCFVHHSFLEISPMTRIRCFSEMTVGGLSENIIEI